MRKRVTERPGTCPHALLKADGTNTHEPGFRGCVGACASLDWASIWPADPTLGDLPHCTISWQYEACAAIGDDFSFLFQMLPRAACSLGFGQNLTNKFLMWCSTPL